MNVEAENVVCPVCTLFLRPGITLKEHLASHPKIKVIEALVRLSNDQLTALTPQTNTATGNNAVPSSGNAFPPSGFGYNQGGGNPQGFPPNCTNTDSVYPASAPYMAQENQNQNWQATTGNVPPQMAMNQSIIYQQIMSSSSAAPSGMPQTMVNNLSQQYVAIPLPGMFNQQMPPPLRMMNSNIMYQQQQVIMNCNLPPLTPLDMGMQQNNIQFPNQNANSCIISPQESRIVQPMQRCIEPPPLTPIARPAASSSSPTRIVEPPKSTSSRIVAPPPPPLKPAPKSPSTRSVVVESRNKESNASRADKPPCSEMVLIREANYMCGPYRAIMANPQSGMVIEEIDPLSMTPSSSPTPFHHPAESGSDPFEITEHDLSGSTFEEPEVKSPEKVSITIDVPVEEEEVDEEEETITPDIQCAQDLRTFYRSPVSEVAPIRAPVITARSPPVHRYSPQHEQSNDINFLSLDFLTKSRKIIHDKSLSDPPSDPLLLDTPPTRGRTTNSRKCSQDDTPLSPSSSVGSDYSLRVRKDLQSQPQAYDENSQNMESFSPRGLQELSDRETIAEQNGSGRHPNLVICPSRTIGQDNGAETSTSHSQTVTKTNETISNSVSTPVSVAFAVDSNLRQSSQPQETLIDMDGVHLMLSNDFMNAQSLISQVDDFECINSNMNQQGSRVLMNIGGMHQELYTEEKKDENKDVNEEDMHVMHRDGLVNIQTDERMPPRGELSEAESNGACDVSWNRIQFQESSSGLSTTYDLFARESWEASDVSDSEAPTTLPPPPPLTPATKTTVPPPPAYSPDMDDTPLIIDVQEPPLNFKCSTCGKGFSCPKERRVHQNKEHSTKKPRVVKPKQPKEPKAPKAPKAAKAPKPRKEPKARKKSASATSPPKTSTVPVPVKTEHNFDHLFSTTSKVLKEESDTKLEITSTETIMQNIVIPAPIIEKKEELCEICAMTFATAKKLKDHLKDEHNIGMKTEYRYTCATCNEKFVTESSYNMHLKLHPLECRICGKYFYRRVNLKLHLKRHMGLKPHKCETCQKAFITKQKLEEHTNIHTGATPIKCNMCDESFRRHSNLVQHRNRYHLNIKKKIKDYICHCGEIYHSKKKLLWHKEIHDLKPKACTYCSEKFIHMSSLTRHMRRAHNQYYVPRKERETENVECPICKGVYLKSSIESHMRTHSGQKLYQCTICNKEFTTKWNLKLHKWTHASRTSKPYKCEQCNGAFIRQTDYIAHMNSHKSIKPYTCNYCGCQFIRKYNCQRHVKEHEEGKSYNCNICGKNFHRSYYLKEHMRVHTGARPYSCHICGKTSTTKSNHNKHVRIHHAREPVSTEG